MAGIYSTDRKLLVRRIPGFRNYFARSDGTIWTIRPRSWMKKPLRKDQAVQMKSHIGPYGYPVISLYKFGLPFTRPVHRFILETFVGQRPEGYHSCHYDGVKTNNDLSNLRWDTPAANGSDSRRNHRAARIKKLAISGYRRE